MENPINKLKPSKGWLKNHFTEILTLVVVTFCFLTFRMVLTKELKASTETEISIIECLKGALNFIFGFWFGSSIGSKVKEMAMTKKNEESEQK